MVNRTLAAVASAALVCGIGVLQALRDPLLRNDPLSSDALLPLLVTLATAALIAIAGRWPGWSLTGLWLLLGFQLFTSTPVMLAQAGVAFVAFACAAWGARRTLALSALSIPAAAAAAVLLMFNVIDDSPWSVWDQLRSWGLQDAARYVNDSAWGWRLVLGAVGLLMLSVPWLLGLAVRLQRASDDSARSQVAAEAERDAASEVASLREGQAQLARDVHDVVGHSLTVILAQAEAGQYQHDPDALHRTLGTIVDTARASLTDVRRVLEDTGSHPLPPAEDALTALLDGVRAGGRDVRFIDAGTVRPLPPDLAGVAHRVLQEMLTNAIRHGRPDAPIEVERHWAGDLRIEVSNSLPGTAEGPGDLTVPLHLDELRAAPASPRTGKGLAGMRRRLDAVGGRMDVRVREAQGTFTATAWIPLPGRIDPPRGVR
ncbi:MAG: sensor histidine kinase [Nocardioides sp.]|uniref:sensor histidine kinase n=1 Tax=Nocardioides sp. TaxID=35761 RepID=UPI003F09A53F